MQSRPETGANAKRVSKAEFLLELSFPWHLVQRIGVHSLSIYQRVMSALPADGHRPVVEIRRDWYY